mmetsp:Transcript_34672/g.107761  ORF Transcript_34672/g.107761 Transcript_34672/m.107761 type:complete len:214 (-) Transcript_34672:8-649(-)
MDAMGLTKWPALCKWPTSWSVSSCAPWSPGWPYISSYQGFSLKGQVLSALPGRGSSWRFQMVTSGTSSADAESSAIGPCLMREWRTSLIHQSFAGEAFTSPSTSLRCCVMFLSGSRPLMRTAPSLRKASRSLALSRRRGEARRAGTNQSGAATIPCSIIDWGSPGGYACVRNHWTYAPSHTAATPAITAQARAQRRRVRKLMVPPSNHGGKLA